MWGEGGGSGQQPARLWGPSPRSLICKVRGIVTTLWGCGEHQRARHRTGTVVTMTIVPDVNGGSCLMWVREGCLVSSEGLIFGWVLRSPGKDGGRSIYQRTSPALPSLQPGGHL